MAVKSRKDKNMPSAHDSKNDNNNNNTSDINSMGSDSSIRWQPIRAPTIRQWPGILKELSKGRLAALVGKYS
jgi:hypothetical protein